MALVVKAAGACICTGQARPSALHKPEGTRRRAAGSAGKAEPIAALGFGCAQDPMTVRVEAALVLLRACQAQPSARSQAWTTSLRTACAIDHAEPIATDAVFATHDTNAVRVNAALGALASRQTHVPALEQTWTAMARATLSITEAYSVATFGCAAAHNPVACRAKTTLILFRAS